MMRRSCLFLASKGNSLARLVVDQEKDAIGGREMCGNKLSLPWVEWSVSGTLPSSLSSPSTKILSSEAQRFVQTLITSIYRSKIYGSGGMLDVTPEEDEQFLFHFITLISFFKTCTFS